MALTLTPRTEPLEPVPPDFTWSGARILVTGAGGFLGSSLTSRLLELGAHVVGVDRRSHLDVHPVPQTESGRLEFVALDLADVDGTRELIRTGAFDCVFHLAAEAEVGQAHRDPLRAFDANVRATYVLYDALASCTGNIRSIIHASTDKVYGDQLGEMEHYTIEHQMKPRGIYETSKACGDLIAQSFAREPFLLPITITRFCNIYGPGQINFTALIPHVIRSALGYGQLALRSNGTSHREYLYVSDAVDVYLALAMRQFVQPLAGEALIENIGSQQVYSVLEIVERIYSAIGLPTPTPQPPAIPMSSTDAHEIVFQAMSAEACAARLLGRPPVSLDAGLQRTIAWLRQYLRQVG